MTQRIEVFRSTRLGSSFLDFLISGIIERWIGREREREQKTKKQKVF